MIQVEAWDLPDAWFRVVKKLLSEGEEYRVGRGSEEALTKKSAFAVEIKNPGDRPLVHEKAPTDQNYLNEYLLDYLFSGEKKEGEEYTYGERMRSALSREGSEVDQIGRVIERLEEEPMDRQCTVTLRYPEDIDSDDPPCLTVLDVEVVPVRPENQASLQGFGEGDAEENRAINFYAYFRSWDAYAGFPTNLGGLQLLKEWMADELGVGDGRLYAFSKNLHLYERQFETVEDLGSESTKSFHEMQSEN